MRYALIGTLLLLSACGFTPMYGTSGDIQANLAQIEINNIPNREGQFLRNELIDRFYTSSRPDQPIYQLQISPIIERIIDLDITKTSDATRSQLHLSTAISLKDLRTSEVVLSKNLNSTSSFNILTSEFSTRVSEQNTRENTLNDLARQIELQIALYLKQ